MWHFVSEHNIGLSHHYSSRTGSLRVKDKELMDIFNKEHGITTTVKMSINKARGHLEVLTLTDITTGDGTKIRPCFGLCLQATH